MSLSIIDWIVIGIYSCVVLSVGFYFSRKEKTSTDFFLGSRNAHWFIIGGSIFAANIGSEHLIGLAGAGTAMLTILGMNQAGGFEGLNEKLGAEYFDMIKPMTDPV